MAELGKFFVTIGSKFDDAGMQKAHQAITKVALAGVAMGAALVAAGLKAAAMAGEQERAELTLAQAMKQAGTYTEKAFQHNINYATSLQKVTTYGDEAIISVQKMLTNFKIEGPMLDGLTKATLDLAAAKGMDLKAAADLVAKSVGSSTNALTRYGITVEGAVGSTERSQMAIENITKLFGGAAQANANTYLGKIEQLKNRWGDFVEAIGTNVIPVVSELIDQINDKVLPAFEDWIDDINKSGEGVKTLATIVKYFIDVFIGVIAAFDMAGTAISSWAATVETAILKVRDKLKFFVPELRWIKGETKIMQDAAKTGWDELAKKLSEYGKIMDTINNFEIKSKEKTEKTKTNAVEDAEKKRLAATEAATKAKQELDAMDKAISLEAQIKYDEAKAALEAISLAESDKKITEYQEKMREQHKDYTNTIALGLQKVAAVEKLTLKSGTKAFGEALKARASRWINEQIIEVTAQKLAAIAIAIIKGTYTFGITAAKDIATIVGGAAAGIAGLRALQKMDEPGIVAGPLGKPVPVMALGGEHFGGRESIAGGNINVYLQPIGTRQEARRIGTIVGNEIFKKVKKSRRI